MKSSAVRSPAQNRSIYGLVAEIGRRASLDTEGRRELLSGVAREVSGQEHTSLLSPSQAEAAIRLLRRRADDWAPLPVAPSVRPSAPPHPTAMPEKAEHEPWGMRGQPRPVETITPRMQAVLSGLWTLAGMESPQQQRGFTERQCKKPWPQSQQDFDKLFEALSSIALRKVQPRAAWERFQRLHGNPGLNAWQVGFVADMLRQYASADDVGRLDHVLTPHKLRKLVEAEVACGIRP